MMFVWGVHIENGKWRVGSIEALQPQEDSPFIGQLDPGKHQLAIETGMYRAPGFAYSTPATDFLLIRNATGAISLRELTGCIAVGQEVPAMRAPIPGSRDVRYGAGVDVGVNVGVGAHSGVIEGVTAGVDVGVIEEANARREVGATLGVDVWVDVEVHVRDTLQYKQSVALLLTCCQL